MIAVWLLAAALGLYALHRLGLYMEGRGWIYYRKARGSSGALANAMLEAHKALEPGNAQVIEARRYERSDDAAQGAPPSGGDDDGR